MRNREAAIRAVWLGLALVALEANAQAVAEASDEDILEILAPELRDARLLTMQELTQEQTDDIGDTPGMGRRFEADFDADGRSDLALFGAFEGGTFVLVASRDRDVWRRSGLVQLTSPFIVGREDRGTLMVFFCTACDSGGRVVWSGAGYEFVPFPPFGVPE